MCVNEQVVLVIHRNVLTHKTAHNLQKWKSTFLTCHCRVIYREEVVDLTHKTSNYIWKKYDFCEYFQFGAISLKIDIFKITASIKSESKILLWHILLWLFDAHHISSLLNRFPVKYRFLFPIVRFLPQNQLALLKDWFLKKMLL